MSSSGPAAWSACLVAGLDALHLRLLQTVLRRCSLVQALREHTAEEQGIIFQKSVLTLATCSSPAKGDAKLMVLHKGVSLSSSMQIEKACARIVGTELEDNVAVLQQMSHTCTCPTTLVTKLVALDVHEQVTMHTHCPVKSQLRCSPGTEDHDGLDESRNEKGAAQKHSTWADTCGVLAYTMLGFHTRQSASQHRRRSCSCGIEAPRHLLQCGHIPRAAN